MILSDTAGIRNSENEIEKKGISLALRKYKEADLNIVVIDNSIEKISANIRQLINKNTIVLLNKSDINNKNNHKFNADTIMISVKENNNIDRLVKKIKEKLSKKFISKKKFYDYQRGIELN